MIFQHSLIKILSTSNIINNYLQKQSKKAITHVQPKITLLMPTKYERTFQDLKILDSESSDRYWHCHHSCQLHHRLCKWYPRRLHYGALSVPSPPKKNLLKYLMEFLSFTKNLDGQTPWKKCTLSTWLFITSNLKDNLHKK